MFVLVNVLPEVDELPLGTSFNAVRLRVNRVLYLLRVCCLRLVSKSRSFVCSLRPVLVWFVCFFINIFFSAGLSFSFFFKIDEP